MRWETDNCKLTQQQTMCRVQTVELMELQRFILNTNYSVTVTVTTDSGNFTSENFMFGEFQQTRYMSPINIFVFVFRYKHCASWSIMKKNC